MEDEKAHALRTITQADAEAALEDVLSELNETLAYLAANGFPATLQPCGMVFEAHLRTPDGIVVLRPEARPKPLPANES